MFLVIVWFVYYREKNMAIQKLPKTLHAWVKSQHLYSTYKNKPSLTKQRSNSRICVSVFIGEKIIVQLC